MSPFVESLKTGQSRIGLWQALANNYTAEICAYAGFDWLLFDGEHSPNTTQTLLSQLQAIDSLPVHAIARIPCHETWVIKQYLDLGFETLLVPMVESATQAEAIVAATRYPPIGVRGVASSTSRAARFGQVTDYLETAENRVGVIAQIESKAGLAAIEDIAAIDGIDALFVGPSDLPAALGYLGDPMAEPVQAAVGDAVTRILNTGKACGIFALNFQDAKNRIAQGVHFVSVGTDIGLLMNGAKSLRAQFE